MSEYLHVEKPFMDQLAAMGWTVVDQGKSGIPSDPAKSLRSNFREWILPEVFRESVRALNVTDSGAPWLTDRQLADLRDQILRQPNLSLLEANEAVQKLLFKAQVDVNEVGDEEDFPVLGLRVTPLPAFHGELPILGFRLGDMAYLTDASEVPESTVKKMKGVRTLVLNALRYKPHPTHLTVEQAVEITRAVAPERAWFIHMTHDLDHEETNRALPEGIALAHDGLEFDVKAELMGSRL